MFSNGILETTTTTGTGDLTTSAVTGRPRFTDKWTANATEAQADHFYYAILTQDNPPQFIESGVGYMSAAGTLKRIAILATYASSTYTDGSPTVVSLAAGTKNVICTGEAGAYAGTLPGVDTSVSALRYIYSAHDLSQTHGSTLALTANRLYAQPFLLNYARTIDGIGFRCSTAVGTDHVRVGIYAVNRDGSPGRKITGSTGDTTIASGTQYVVTALSVTPVRLAPGWYYTAMVSDAASTLNVGASSAMTSPLGNDNAANFGVISYGYLANGSTTLPDPFGALTGKVVSANHFASFLRGTA